MTENKERHKAGVLEYLLTHHRGIFATLVLIPISLIYGWYIKIRRRVTLWKHCAPELHDRRVQNIVNQVNQWIKEGCPERLTTSRSGWFSMSQFVAAYKMTNRAIEMPLYDIIRIDEINETVVVEPLVNMGQLSRELNKKGWTLAVLPELDVLTVGGLINGFGIESSSHKYGLFQYALVSFDLVTPDGQLRHCSQSENEELFYTVPWSHGTLGLLVAAELKILRAKPYIRLTYEPLRGLENIVSRFEEVSRNKEIQFVEMLQFGRDEAVLMVGEFVDRPSGDGPINRIGRWYKPWFYSHVQGKLTKDEVRVEYLPLNDYYHRHTRGLFWEMSEVIPFANKPLFRWLLGWSLPPEMSLMKYFETETTMRLRDKYHVVQDMLVPISALGASLEYFDNQYLLYPLWICPMEVREYPKGLGFIQPLKNENGQVDELFVDIGAYGSPKAPNFDGDTALRKLEQFVIEHNGFQAMYAKTLMSKEQFRTMFNHSGYDALRAQITNVDKAFPEVYDKLSGKARLSPVEYRKLKRELKK
jgi:Delta24-sterol reductase